MKSFPLIFLTLCLPITLSAQNLPNYVPTNGLVGWWPLNGNVNDISGNQLNGTVFNTISTTDKNGYSSSALEFNGTTSYTEINSNSLLDSIVDELTLTAWIKPYAQSNSGTIIARRNFVGNPNGERHHFELTISPSSTMLRSNNSILASIALVM